MVTVQGRVGISDLSQQEFLKILNGSTGRNTVRLFGKNLCSIAKYIINEAVASNPRAWLRKYLQH